MQQVKSGARAIIWCAVSGKSQVGEEHYSMDEQEKWAVETCKKNGWRVLEILRVPGHSRNYRDFHQLASDARSKGIDAFDRLKAHLDNCDFDVLVCRDVNRLARSATLVHWMLETIIDDCSACVYSQHDGWINAENVDGFAAIKGYSTNREIKWIKDAAARGKRKRLERGLPVGPWVNLSHKRVRDLHTGEDVALIVNDDNRPLFNAIAILLLEGVGWRRMGELLYTRWGILSPRGKVYSANTLYNMLYNPMLWGHMAIGHSRKTRDMWVFEPNHPVPEGVSIEYNVIPAFFDDITAERVRSELIRRWGIIGKARPDDTAMFSGICTCLECGGSMSVVTRLNRHTGVRCPNVYKNNAFTGNRLCTNKTKVTTPTLKAFWTAQIMQMLNGRTWNDFLELNTIEEKTHADDLEQQLNILYKRMDVLIDEQSLASDVVQPSYRKKIEDIGKLINDLTQLYERHRLQEQNDSIRHQAQAQAIEDIQQYTMDDFWSLPTMVINRHLKRLLGQYKIGCLNGQIVKLVPSKFV